MSEYIELPRECPSCKVDFTGDPIPEKYRDNYFGGRTRFSRCISIYDRQLDRTVAYQCPDCSHVWKR